MLRYTKQRNGFSCGPVAILNAMSWAGKGASYYEAYPALEELCICESHRGTSQGNFDRALRIVGTNSFRVRRVCHPSLSEIDEHLNAGQALVLNYVWKREQIRARHLLLLIGISESGNSYYTVNDSRTGPALQRQTRRIFKERDLRFIYGNDPFYKAWFLYK